MVKKASWLILLAALGIIAYANSLGGAFIWDDNILITDNAVVKSWSSLPKVFTKENISTPTGKTFHFYRPLQTITYMADHAIGGLTPRVYHITNVLLHVLVSLALFWCISVLYGDTLLAFVAAAVFTVHPVHAEAVAYISGRADPLAALFMLVSAVYYVKCTERGRIAYYAAAFFAFALALFSRENSLVLPALLLAYHFTSGKRVKGPLFAPMLAIAGGYIALRLVALKHLLPVFSSMHRTAALERVPGFFAAIAGYLKLLVLPYNLHMEYGDKVFRLTDQAVMAGAAAAGIMLVVALAGRRLAGGKVSFGLLWFLIALLPVSNIYPVGAYMAEHWLYLPSIGIFLIAASAFRGLYSLKFMKAVSVAAAAALVVYYSYLTILQNDYWKDQIEFYERTLLFAPESIRANNDLAIAYEKIGKHDEAVEIYRELIRINPNQPDVYVNLAAVYLVTGKTDYAIAMCEKALSLEPINATARNNLAVAYYMQGKFNAAIEQCDLAVKYGYKVNPRLLEMLEPYRK